MTEEEMLNGVNMDNLPKRTIAEMKTADAQIPVSVSKQGSYNVPLREILTTAEFAADANTSAAMAAHKAEEDPHPQYILGSEIGTTIPPLVGGAIPRQYLPGSYNEVQYYDDLGALPVVGESDVIYVVKDTRLTYMWGGASYVPLDPSLALGETPSTAYRGDRGKVAYDHSQSSGNPHGTTPSDMGAEPAITSGAISQFWAGTKSWRDLAADVRSVALTGLSTATASVISATDSVLVSLGKLQAQITANLSALASHTGNTGNPHSTTAAQVGAEPAIASGTVSQFWAGTKAWRDLAADVRAVVLTGLSTASASVISATDTVLVSLGKLQAQITANLSALATHTSNTSNPHSTTAAQVGAEPAITGGTVSQFWAGTKAWRDLATDVRAVVLTGLSTATSSAIAATDSILVALGKLQAQINVRLTSVTGDATSRTANTVYAAPNGSAGTAAFRALAAADLPTVTVVKGGTGKTTWAAFSTLFASAANVLAELAPNTSTTKKFLRMTGTGSAGATPAWDTVTASDVGLGNVNNTADVDKPVSTAVSTALANKLSMYGYPKQIGGISVPGDYFITQTDFNRGLTGEYRYYMQEYELAIIAQDDAANIGKTVVQVAFSSENNDTTLDIKVLSGDFDISNRVYNKVTVYPAFVRVELGLYIGVGYVAAGRLLHSSVATDFTLSYFDTPYIMGGTKVYGLNEHHCGNKFGNFTSNASDVLVNPNTYYGIYAGVSITLSNATVPNGSEVCFVGAGCSSGSSTVNGVTFSWPSRYMSLRYFDGQWRHQHPA